MVNWHGYINNETGKFYVRSDACKRATHALTYMTCSLPVKTCKFICIDALSTSRRIHANARNKAGGLWVTSPGGYRLSYLHIAGEVTRNVIAVLPAIAVVFACNCGYFYLQLLVFLPGVAYIFFLRLRVFLLTIVGVFACNLNVILPAKAGNFACQSRVNLHEFRT